MGVSNSEMLDLNSLEIDFLEKPTLEFQDQEYEIAPLLNGELYEINQVDDQDQEEDQFKVMVASLKMNIPSLGEFKIEDDDKEDFDGGFKTPRTSDHKIPVVLQCPAAPRKPKSKPLSTKRKVQSQRRVLYDLSNEIEALFPPALLADLGNKIKKAKQEN